MKQNTAMSIPQKAFSLLMATLLLTLAVFAPYYSEASENHASSSGTQISAVSLVQVPNITPAPEPLTVLPVLFLLFPKAWTFSNQILASEISEYRTVFLQFFIRKINFVFVSTQAP